MNSETRLRLTRGVHDHCCIYFRPSGGSFVLN